MNRSATPLVSGSRTKAKLGVMPRKVIWFWTWSDIKALPWSWRSRRPRAASARTAPQALWMARSRAWAAAKRAAFSATCQPSASAFQCSTTTKRATLPSSTVGITAASVPHITLGASVVMRPSWSLTGLCGPRCGESRAFSRMRRSTRSRPTRRPSSARRAAHTLGWPSAEKREGCAGRRRRRSAAAPGCRNPAVRRRPRRLPGSSRRPSARPPAGQRAGALDAGAEQLDLHGELTDPPMGFGQLALSGILGALAQPGLEPGEGPRLPTLQLPDRHAELPGDGLDRLTPQQAQHDLVLAGQAPALTGRKRTSPGGLPCDGRHGRAALALAAHKPR